MARFTPSRLGKLSKLGSPDGADPGIDPAASDPSADGDESSLSPADEAGADTPYGTLATEEAPSPGAAAPATATDPASIAPAAVDGAAVSAPSDDPVSPDVATGNGHGTSDVPEVLDAVENGPDPMRTPAPAAVASPGAGSAEAMGDSGTDVEGTAGVAATPEGRGAAVPTPDVHPSTPTRAERKAAKAEAKVAAKGAEQQAIAAAKAQVALARKSGRGRRLVLRLLLVAASAGAVAFAAVVLWPEFQDRVLERLDSNTARTDQLAEQISANEATMAELQDDLAGRIDDLAADVATVDDLVADIEARAEATQPVQQSLDLLGRARLFLYQANYGLARDDLAAAREVLADLPDSVEALDGGAVDLGAVRDRLDSAIAKLPAQPVLAADEVDIAWQLLLGSPPAAAAAPDASGASEAGDGDNDATGDAPDAEVGDATGN